MSSSPLCRQSSALRILLPRWPVLLCLLTTLAAPSLWAAPSPPPVANLFGSNGGFESSTAVTDNLWDGVNSDGFLCGFNHSAKVVVESGGFGGLAMPPSVAFVDLNGDGKPDLLTADPSGYFRFYPNSGTPTAPKFTSAELVPMFLSMTYRPRIRDHDWAPTLDDARFCPRFALADWRHSGLLDMLVGDYFGDVFFLPNTGSARQPVWTPTGGADRPPSNPETWGRDVNNRQPTSAERARIPTNDQGRYWGNLLSPAAYDWNGDGKPDLICGEGTYSANAIHLLENIGTGTPKFANAQHTYIAYGDGREQLLPTVTDINGDGFPDLIVADRTGEVSVYLGIGKPKAGVELPRTSTLTFGGRARLPGLCSLYAADYNGDGVTDLIIGLPNGHLAVSLNTGTKTAPAFGPLEELKGEDRLGRNIRAPLGWSAQTWSIYGNALSYFSVVNAQTDPASAPPEGGNCLKAGYWPMTGQTFPMPAEGIPGGWKHFTLTYRSISLDINKKYHISFKTKGAGLEHLRWTCYSHFEGYPSSAKIERGERGEVKNTNEFIDEVVNNGTDFNASSNWNTVEGDFTPRYKNQGLRDAKQMPVVFYVDFWAQNLASVIYLDDFHLALDTP